MSGRGAVEVATGLLLSILAFATTAAPESPPVEGADPGVCRQMGLRRCPVPFDRSVPPARDMLTWTPQQRIVGFRNTYRQYPQDAFHADPGHVLPLPAYKAVPKPRYIMNGRACGLEDYIGHQNVTGLLVLKDGQIVIERYTHGNTQSTLWTSRSVAKSIVSVLVGIAVHEGFIRSVDDQVTQYLPELEGTAWEGVSLRNLLQHTSGVRWNENYADTNSDFAQLNRCEAQQGAFDCVLQLVRSVQRQPGVSPGELWSYNTGGAWLVGRVLERATRMTVARYLESRLWRRVGMEADGIWEALVPGRVDMGGHGFNATLRDWGRFGWFVASGGRLPGGQALLPSDWMRQSTNWTRARGSVTPTTPEGQYGYQWWHLGAPQGSTDGVKVTAAQTIWALGIYGQALAINPTSGVVMVQWSAHRDADGPDSLYDEQLVFFSAVEQALSGGLALEQDRSLGR